MTQPGWLLPRCQGRCSYRPGQCVLPFLLASPKQCGGPTPSSAALAEPVLVLVSPTPPCGSQLGVATHGRAGGRTEGQA